MPASWPCGSRPEQRTSPSLLVGAAWAFYWAPREVGDGALRAETEALSEGAHALYLSKGLSQVFAEDVMQLAGRAHPPATHGPEGLILSP